MTMIKVLFRGQSVDYKSNSEELFNSNLRHAVKTVGGDRSVIQNGKGSIWKNNKKIATFKISQT